MNNLRRLFCVSMVLVAGYAGAALGQAPPEEALLDAKSVAADVRLKAPVTLHADRMYLGEVLEKLSTQTGVSVSIPAEDRASGAQITCDVKNMPLADFLNALGSLVSYSKAAWQINSDPQQKTPSYQLLPTAPARALPERLLRETDKVGMNLAVLMVKLSTMKQPEREANVTPFVEAMLLDNDGIAGIYLKDERFWAPLRAFATGLTPEQQAQVRKGEALSIPLSKVDADTQAQLQAMRGPQGFGNGAQQDNAPDTVRFEWTQYGPDRKKHLTKDLWIGVGNARGFASRDYMAPLEPGLSERFYDGWILPGDLRNTDAEKQKVSFQPGVPAPPIVRDGPSLQIPILRPGIPFPDFLTLLASAQNASFIGVIPESAENKVVVTAGAPASQFLIEQWGRARLMHKCIADKLSKI